MGNQYGLFFTRDNLVIRLPVNPEKFPLENPSTNQTYNVLGIGEVMQARTPGLRKFTISSYFPGRPYTGVLTPNDFKEPEFYIGFFRRAMEERESLLFTPVRYYEDGTPYMTQDTGFRVLVNGFSFEERGGETGDFYYDLDLVEYRDFSPKRVVIKQPEATQPQQVQQATQEPVREIPPQQIVVGSRCVLNGNYYYSSYGDTPYGSASGRTVLVQYIVDLDRAKPYHVTTEEGGALGWTDRGSLQVIS